MNNPKLVILDEPTNGLVPIGIQEFRELIKSFPAKGITIILSSHILSEVELITDHIGIIAGGILGYSAKMKSGENLEQLFMQVVSEHLKFKHTFRSIFSSMVFSLGGVVTLAGSNIWPGLPIPIGSALFSANVILPRILSVVYHFNAFHYSFVGSTDWRRNDGYLFPLPVRRLQENKTSINQTSTFAVADMCISSILAYYSNSPWNPITKVEAYLQVLGIEFPFLIALSCVSLVEQESAQAIFKEC